MTPFPKLVLTLLLSSTPCLVHASDPQDSKAAQNEAASPTEVNKLRDEVASLEKKLKECTGKQPHASETHYKVTQEMRESWPAHHKATRAEVQLLGEVASLKKQLKTCVSKKLQQSAVTEGQTKTTEGTRKALKPDPKSSRSKGTDQEAHPDHDRTDLHSETLH